MIFTLVGCRNADGFHKDSEVEYLIYRSVVGTEIIRRPRYSTIRDIIPKGETIKLLWRPCAICRSRGIKGFTHIPDDNLPPDEFEIFRKEGGRHLDSSE